MSKSAEQPPRHTFFLDENLGGSKVYNAISAAEIPVEKHSDHFKPGTADEEWLPVVGKRGWILITQDKHIRWRKNELEALREHNVCAFFVAAKELRGEQIGDLLVKAMPKIERLLKRNEPPIIATVTRDSVVVLKEGKARYPKKKDS